MALLAEGDRSHVRVCKHARPDGGLSTNCAALFTSVSHDPFIGGLLPVSA